MHFAVFSYVWYFYHALLFLVTTFISALSDMCYDYFPVSQMLYSLFLYEIIDWILEKIPVRNGGSKMGRERTQTGL